MNRRSLIAARLSLLCALSVLCGEISAALPLPTKPNLSFRVDNRKGFENALCMQPHASGVTINVIRGFSLEGKPIIDVPAPDCHLTVIAPATLARPKISFAMTWANTQRVINGWFIKSKSATLTNIEVANFDALGGAIKMDAGGSLILHRCHWSNIGNGPFITLDPPVSTEKYTRRFTTAAGGFNLKYFGAFDCSALGVGTNGGAYSHWFSYSAESHHILNCTGIGVGLPFASYDNAHRPGVIANCTWWAGACKMPTGTIRPPFIVNAWTDLIGMKIMGAIGMAYEDDYGLFSRMIDDNDFSHAFCAPQFYRDRQGIHDRQYWVEVMQRDTHSKWPATLPAN
jgi:hypothetical protein